MRSCGRCALCRLQNTPRDPPAILREHVSFHDATLLVDQPLVKQRLHRVPGRVEAPRICRGRKRRITVWLRAVDDGRLREADLCVLWDRRERHNDGVGSRPVRGHIGFGIPPSPPGSRRGHCLVVLNLSELRRRVSRPVTSTRYGRHPRPSQLAVPLQLRCQPRAQLRPEPSKLTELRGVGEGDRAGSECIVCMLIDDSRPVVVLLCMIPPATEPFCPERVCARLGHVDDRYQHQPGRQRSHIWQLYGIVPFIARQKEVLGGERLEPLQLTSPVGILLRVVSRGATLAPFSPKHVLIDPRYI